ncbi:MAG: response regulator [Rhodoferax sp.]|jgi:signal transduction histidine kinase/CheY-like chemotaxis protein|nr:response regulator [Rhodoferax sp.]
MKLLDIRSRMLLAALLPLVLISTLLAIFFLFARFSDIQDAYQQRIRTVTRQLALASEYSLFSANQQQLHKLVAGVLREPDVRWAGVLDAGGQTLASAGHAGSLAGLVFVSPEGQSFAADTGLDGLAQPVIASELPLDDLYQGITLRPEATPLQLGLVRVVFSRQSLDLQRRNMLLLGALIGALGLAFGVGLAAWLSAGVIRPIMRITRLIEQIGRGDFSEARAARDLAQLDDPLHDLQDNLHRMADRLAYARDDLERQVALATQALRAKKEEAEQATQAKSRFLAAASHDLRQPMHALGMFISRLAQLSHDAQTGQLVVQLQASVGAMQKLLDGLLDLSRLDAQAVPVKPGAFALSTLFEQLAHDLAQTASDKGLRLRIRASPLWVMSDATLVYRILLNLVSNALRYTEHGGVLLAARLSNSGQQVLLQVWDSGIGIAPEHQQAVFAEFYQVANAARNRTLGLGLGLNIVQRTAALLGHPLQLTSQLGRGTRFTLTLPRVQPGLSAPAADPPEPQRPDELRGIAVLVIDDDPLVLAAVASVLDGWGMRVCQALGLSQARQQLEAGCQPAVIVCDYRLQEELNGIEVIQQLRGLLAQLTPACLLSGDTDPGLMQAAQVAGLTLLHKPVRPAKLRSLLRRLVQNQDQKLIDDDLP